MTTPQKNQIDFLDPNLELAEAALLIAQDEYPDLDIPLYLRRFDEWAERANKRIPEKASIADAIGALNHVLFKEERFSGNALDYYDPRNSFLNEVMDRKVGIPITLSIIYLEVGQRIGLPLVGVSFPGHFLVKCAIQEGDVILDPFAGGASLGKEELETQLEHIYGKDNARNMALAPLLIPAENKEILARLLRNLKAIYLHHNKMREALNIVDRMLTITPDSAGEIRDRGLIYQQLECHRAALEDLRRYLNMDPAAEDAEEIRIRLIELQRVAARIN